MTTAESLEQWREASRAAQLAERLAELAKESVERSDSDAVAAQEIAKFAQRAARHAERAAQVARDAAERATAFAAQNRAGRLAESDEDAAVTRADEGAARDAYHQAEQEVREHHQKDGADR